MCPIDVGSDPSTPSDGGPAPDGGTKTTTTTEDGTTVTTKSGGSSGNVAIKIVSPGGKVIRILVNGKTGEIIHIEK